MRTLFLTTGVGLLLAGCAADPGAYAVSSLSDVYPHRTTNAVVASAPALDSGSNAMPSFSRNVAFTTNVVSGGPSLVKMPVSSAQGMPQSVNSLPVGAVAMQ